MIAELEILKSFTAEERKLVSRLTTLRSEMKSKREQIGQGVVEGTDISADTQACRRLESESDQLWDQVEQKYDRLQFKILVYLVCEQLEEDD